MQKGKSIEPSRKATYDVIVVGSGAAGGMAAFVLATKGVKVLLLEAGGNTDVYKSKTMEWPYETPYRGGLAPSQHALNVAEYEMLDRPYGLAKEMAPYNCTRLGDDPKTSVTNSFGQTHDIRNLFLADGSIFVSAANQNPTWTILALSMRGSEYLADELKKGNV